MLLYLPILVVVGGLYERARFDNKHTTRRTVCKHGVYWKSKPNDLLSLFFRR